MERLGWYGMGKSKVIVVIFMVILLFAAVLVYFDARLIDKTQQTAHEPMDTGVSAVTGTADKNADTKADSGNEETTPESTGTSSAGTEPKEPVKNEKIDINGNTPEYGIELRLCESSDGRIYLNLQYYLNGIAKTDEFDEGELPELSGIFENREKEQADTNAFRVGQAILNPVHSQLYLLIHGAPLGAYSQSAFYLIDLGDLSVKKLFSYPGLYGKIACNKDYSLLAYSFGDPPHLSALQEDNLIDIFDCKSGEYVIKNSRDKSGNILGTNSNPGYLYDYEFESWQSGSILRLRQATRHKNDPDSGLAQTEVLYDVDRNLLLLPDGSEQKIISSSSQAKAAPSAGTTGSQTVSLQGEAGKTGSTKNAEEDGSADADIMDSEPVKALQDFYTCLAQKDEYTKAMLILDDDFQLKLGMLKQFGADIITKSDISVDSATAYSELLKAAKLDTITKAETKDNVCIVSYYQILELGTDSQLRQFMSAQLKKTDEAWKITLIEDGTE